MRLAQQLYEGVDIKGSGTVGLITYLRTDSTRVSEEAEAAASEYISANYGADYVCLLYTSFEKYRRRFSPYCSVASLYLWAVSGGAIPGMKDYAPKTIKSKTAEKKVK